MKKYNKLIFFTLMTVLVFTAYSCLKDEDGEKREKEKRLIENYIQINNITTTPSSSGLYFIPVTEGTGATPANTDYALIRYKSTDLNGTFYDGTDKALAEQNKVNPIFALGGPFKIHMSGFYSGVTEALKQMKEGGKAKLVMPSLLIYNDYVPRIVEVELLKVISNPKAYEQGQIATLLDTAYNMELGDSIISGIYHIEKVAGTGIQPSGNKLVKMKYKGYLPDGRVFDTSEADTFKFRVGSGQVIVGLDEGVRQMKKGGKSTIIIPFYKGFGFNYVSSYGQIIIPYFSTTVFDVELLDVTD